MPKVLVVSTSRYTHGGITAVLKLYENSEIWSKYHCRWIGTHRDGNKIIKLYWAIKALILYLLLLPFYDIVHIHFSLKPSAIRKFPFFKIAKLFHKKTIIHLHCGSQIDDIWSPIYQTMFDQCDYSIVLSESLKSKVVKRIGEKNNIHVINNPCPKKSYNTKYKKQNHILFAGTLCEGKGYKDLIKAFSLIANKYPEWKIVLAGNGETEQAQTLAKKLNISERTILLGWVNGEEKHKAFCEADIFCLPSYAEGFPMAVLDAFAYGLPVITTTVGGIPDIAVDGENMLLFAPDGNIENLSRCLERLIIDKHLREKFSKESFHLANTTFNINTITQQISELYEKVVRQ